MWPQHGNDIQPGGTFFENNQFFIEIHFIQSKVIEMNTVLKLVFTCNND